MGIVTTFFFWVKQHQCAPVHDMAYGKHSIFFCLFRRLMTRWCWQELFFLWSNFGEDFTSNKHTSKEASNHQPVDRSGSNLSSLLSAIQGMLPMEEHFHLCSPNSGYLPRISAHHRGPKRPTPQRYLTRIRKAGWEFSWGPGGSCGWGSPRIKHAKENIPHGGMMVTILFCRSIWRFQK